eukprot:CAMPEP_0170574330 /NCGR_PEP_ID=MMETSP0224-20130122/3241_1 /TAXON_ID=285029 /ORGANISM="Togula jolla, Strain CCCM 725" /LENGTH=87 /DNA_ID=CAMNT_0010896977 /DNA_START=160 /DNA_END=423 /DNA_ORIENTATION=+
MTARGGCPDKLFQNLSILKVNEDSVADAEVCPVVSHGPRSLINVMDQQRPLVHGRRFLEHVLGDVEAGEGGEITSIRAGPQQFIRQE